MTTPPPPSIPTLGRSEMDNGVNQPDPSLLDGVHHRIDHVERSLGELEEALSERIARLEQQMQASNAHLDNISRASDKTNVLLEELGKQMRRREDRDDRRDEANRRLVTGAAGEVWETVKHPLAYGLMALATWFAITQLGVKPSVPVDVDEPVSVETLDHGTSDRP
jgi:hypothetical protein